MASISISNNKHGGNQHVINSSRRSMASAASVAIEIKQTASAWHQRKHIIEINGIEKAANMAILSIEMAAKAKISK